MAKNRGSAILASAALLYLAVYAVWMPVDGAGVVLRGFVYLVPGAVSLTLAPSALRRTHGRERVGWLCVTIVAGCWLSAEVYYALHTLTGIEPPAPSLADLFYYLGYAALIVSVPLLSPPQRRAQDRRVLIDAAIIVVAMGAFGWEFLVTPQHAAGSPLLQQAVLLGYPLLDMGVISALVIAYYGSVARFPHPVVALVAAAACTVAADIPYLMGAAADPRLPSWVDLGWLAGYWFVGLALYGAGRDNVLEPELSRSRAQSPAGLILPYAAVAPVAMLTLGFALAGPVPPGLIAGAALSIVLLLLRQWLTLRENRSLTLALEEEILNRNLLLEELEMRAAELEQAHAQARYEAEHDSLTGLLNRRAWFTRAADPGVQVVAIFDIDHFKRINDTYGHPVGDHVLREVAWRLGGMIGGEAEVGRLGGEEFAACFFAPYESATASCYDAVEMIATMPILLPTGEEIPVSVSAGIAACAADDGGDAIEHAYEAADNALYLAKQGGRRQLVEAEVDARAA